MTRTYFHICRAMLVIAVVALLVHGQTTVQHSPEKDLAASLIAAKTPEERAALLKASPELLTARLAQAFVDEEDRLSQSNRAELKRVCQIAVEVAERIGDKHEIARALLNLGNAADRDEKLPIFELGLNRSEEADDQAMVAKFLLVIGELQESLDRQRDFYERGLKAADKVGDKKAVAGALGRIGNIYTQKGDYVSAGQRHVQALAIREEIGDMQGISISYSNLGLVDQMQGSLDAATRHFQKSIEISEAIGDVDGVAIDSYNLGNVYLVKGDFSDAMTLYLKSLALSEKLGSSGGIEGASTNIANLYNAQGNYEQARYYLNRAVLIADRTGKTIPEYALSGYADSYKGEGRFEEAIAYYQRLLKSKEDTGNKDRIAETLIDIGNCYLLMGKPAPAEENLRSALVLTESTGSNVGSFRALQGLAKTQLARKDFRAALENANRAKSYFEKLNGSSEDWDLYTTLGRAHIGLGQTEIARLELEKAIAAVENLRNRLAGSSTDRQGFFQTKTSPYHLMTELAVADGSKGKAYEYAERAKARTLLDVLGQGRVNIGGSMSQDQKNAEQGLRNQLVSLTTQIENEFGSKSPSQSRIDELEMQLADKRLEFKVFQDRMYAQHPELRTQRGEMKPISLEETAALMPDEKTAAIAEYLVTEDKTFLFVITKAAAKTPSLKVFTLDVSDKDLGNRIEAYRSKLAGGELDFGKASRALYDLLIDPASAQLAGKTDLIIVPDGPLWDLPFQSLRNGRDQYLVERAAVSYAPSVTTLKEMAKTATRRKSNAGADLLAFGNPKVRQATADKIQQIFSSQRLEPIPEAERLVNELGKMYGPRRSKVFTGPAAREETAKTESSKYRIVQFATHGILNNASPMYSHLVLAQNEKDASEDGLLEAWELKDLDLRADMVILSACETARGKIANGEGVIGMTWAAFIAGAPTTVASQWKVESSSTTELMLEFHRQLLTGRVSKTEALRRAELKLIRTAKYKHPSYWAGFVLVGDGS